MGMKFSKPVREKSEMYRSEVIRIPIIENRNKYIGAPELNLSNRNAYHIFHDILQYEGEHSFSMSPEDLKERIEATFHDRSWISKHVIHRKETDIKPSSEDDEWKTDDASSDEENPHDKISSKIGAMLGGGKSIDMGLDESQIIERLERIYEIAKWAIQHGHPKITVA